MAKKLVLANNPLFSGPKMDQRGGGGGSPYREIPLSAIERDPNQPRVVFNEDKLDELAASITTYGVLTPILVKESKLPGKYNLVAGERRFRASKLAGLSTIPAIVDKSVDETGERTLTIQLVENIQRSDLKPLERAHAIGALKDAYQLSVRKVADGLGVSKSMVQRSLEILDLPDDLLNALREGAPESKVLALSKITDSKKRKELLENLDSVTREEITKKPNKKSSKAKKKVKLSPDDVRITDEIQRALGLKVKMNRPKTNSENGKLEIEFYSNDDLQEIFRKLVNE